MKLNKKKTAFTLALVLFTICLLEIVLLVLCMVSPTADNLLTLPATFYPQAIPDDHLGIKPNPKFPGHDRNGFNNKNVPAQSDIVILGDSQTYGVGVKRQEAWPQQLEAMSHHTVYTMAYGSFGPVHYLTLSDDAIAFHPKIIIEAFYSGNDLYDSFTVVYNQSQHSELQSEDAAVLSSIHTAENREPISTSFIHNYQFGVIEDNQTDIKKILLKYSRLVGLYRSVKTLLWANHGDSWQEAMIFARSHSDYCEIFENGKQKTIFTPHYRLSALNMSDSRIAEGLTISMKAIQAVYKKVTQEHIQFIVLLLPTKETVFKNFVLHPSDNYRSLIKNEQLVIDSLKSFMLKNNIEFLDALPALQAQCANGMQPYHVTWDGHPNKYGHEAIASYVFSHLKNNKSVLLQ